jgi:hypothetical protein
VLRPAASRTRKKCCQRHGRLFKYGSEIHLTNLERAIGETRDSVADVWGERARHLHALSVMSAEVNVSLTVVMQASKELRDDELLGVCIYLDEQNKRQQAWLVTQIEHRVPHTLVVPQ